MAAAAAMEVENAQLAQQLAASQAELAATADAFPYGFMNPDKGKYKEKKIL